MIQVSNGLWVKIFLNLAVLDVILILKRLMAITKHVIYISQHVAYISLSDDCVNISSVKIIYIYI